MALGAQAAALSAPERAYGKASHGPGSRAGGGGARPPSPAFPACPQARPSVCVAVSAAPLIL